MTSDYGTNPGHKEQLSGYFDVNNENVTINKGYRVLGPCTKNKKIGAIVGVVAVILLIIIIIIAVVASQKPKQPAGEISSLKSGQSCSGDISKQSMCKSGECIQNIFVCDGMDDCSDGGDEVKSLCDAFKRKGPCTDSQFQCLITRTCISDHKRCDGRYDCGGKDDGDYSDERGCFSIDQNTEVVSLTKNGETYPVADSIDSRVTELICLDMGFKSLQYITSGHSYGDDEDVTCAVVKAGFEPTEDMTGEETELINNMVPFAKCTGKALTMICENHFCGVFGKYPGPSVPDSWVSPEMKNELARSTTRFPWVVEIYKGNQHKCKGTIVDREWILTSENCIDDRMFLTHDEEKAWRIIAGSTTSSPQTRTVSKVVRNHFKDMIQRNQLDIIVAVQVDPPFDLNGMIHQVCLSRPALLPHFNCYMAASEKKGSSDIKHVRVIPSTNSSKCGNSDIRQGTFCFEYPHADNAKPCLRANGSPISCLDPAKNSWTLAGISTDDIGCNIDHRLAATLDDEFNYYWAEIVTAPARVYDATMCANKAEFQALRFMSGSRQGEVYMDILGWGDRKQWHTIYNFTSAIDLLKPQIAEAQNYPTIQIANNTGITSRFIALLNCPPGAGTLCACRVEYKRFAFSSGEAPSLHFIDDADKNGIIDDNDFNYENWDADNNFDDLSEDYEDYTEQEPVNLEVFFPEVCPEADKSDERQCVDGKGCVKIDYICDGYKNCSDGSDEVRETCEQIAGSVCPTKWFKCRTSYDCIPTDSRCDGVVDCIDMSDERECVTVADNSIVFVEKEGLRLPLGGLPKEVSDATEQYLATALCKYMGFGEFQHLDTYNNGSVDFSQGCYKLRTRRFGNSFVESADFSKYSADECDTTLFLVCNPPGCGITASHTGPAAPSSWPAWNSPSSTDVEYPWVVHIKKGSDFVCGATIVLSQWIVTTFDCVTELTSDMTVQFQDRGSSNTEEYKITHRVDFRSTKTQPKTKEPIERNIAMFGVNPGFELSERTHPLCLLPPLYIDNSICFLSGHDQENVLRHVRVVPRDPEVCEEAGISISQAIEDEQCVELLDQSNICIDAKGSSLQCLDQLRNQWKFTAIMTMSIGKACEGNSSTLARATNNRYLLPWIFNVVDDIENIMNITCTGEAMDGDVHRIAYHNSNYDDEFYMITAEGLAIEWGGDEPTLDILAEPLVERLGAFKVTDGRQSENITALTTLSLSECDKDTLTCSCTKNQHPTAVGVKTFFVVSVNDDYEEERDREFQDEEDVISDYDYSTPSEMYSSFE